MLNVDHLSAGYGRIEVVHEVDLTVEEGEVVAILGPNGAGKSTLLKAIAGLVLPRSGHVWLNGAEVTRLGAETKVRHGLVLVPERRELFGQLSVEENLRLGAYTDRECRSHPGRFNDRLRTVHELFPGLREKAAATAQSLSGGQQQMVAIGRALMSAPRLLLLDEPFMGLAPLVVRSIVAAMRRLIDGGLTVILSEQNTALALSLASRGYILRSGRVEMAGKCETLLNNPEIQHLYLGA